MARKYSRTSKCIRTHLHFVQGRKYAKNKSLFDTNNDGNQQQLELQVENKTEHTLNFREKIQRDSMIEALEKTNGNVSLAKTVRCTRSTFYKRMQKYKL